MPANKMTLCKCDHHINSATLNLDGIYVARIIPDNSIEPLYEILFLYKDGSIYNYGFKDSLDNLNEELKQFKFPMRDKKYDKQNWGCFNITDNIITVQQFNESGGGMFVVLQEKGNVLSPTEFELSISLKSGKEILLKSPYRFSFYSNLQLASENWIIKQKCK